MARAPSDGDPLAGQPDDSKAMLQLKRHGRKWRRRKTWAWWLGQWHTALHDGLGVVVAVLAVIALVAAEAPTLVPVLTGVRGVAAAAWGFFGAAPRAEAHFGR